MVLLSKSTPPFEFQSSMVSIGLFCFYPHNSELNICYRCHISHPFRTRFQAPKQQFCYKMRRQDSKELELLKTDFEGKSQRSCTFGQQFFKSPVPSYSRHILSSNRYSYDFFRTFLAQSWKWQFLVKIYDCHASVFHVFLRFEGKAGILEPFYGVPPVLCVVVSDRTLHNSVSSDFCFLNLIYHVTLPQSVSLKAFFQKKTKKLPPTQSSQRNHGRSSCFRFLWQFLRPFRWRHGKWSCCRSWYVTFYNLN